MRRAERSEFEDQDTGFLRIACRSLVCGGLLHLAAAARELEAVMRIAARSSLCAEIGLRLCAALIGSPSRERRPKGDLRAVPQA